MCGGGKSTHSHLKMCFEVCFKPPLSPSTLKRARSSNEVKVLLRHFHSKTNSTAGKGSWCVRVRTCVSEIGACASEIERVGVRSSVRYGSQVNNLQLYPLSLSFLSRRLLFPSFLYSLCRQASKQVS